jgi:AcrR family transcriptional regulator
METADLLERCYPGRRAELKRDIFRKALQLFNEQGIEATTIEMIRAECDTSVGAIYHHFGNKEGLVAALFFTALDDQAKLRDSYLADAQTTQAGVHALVHSYVDWVEWLGASARVDVLRGYPPELLPSLIIGQAESYCRAWLSGRAKASPKAYRDLLADSAWRSIATQDH